jgi:hypothetical protein
MTHFTGAIWTTGKARAAPLCQHNKQRATPPVVQIARPPVGRLGPPGSLRRLPDDPHRAAHRAYPGDPIRTHEMGHYQ